jgi:hypothetical protein
MSRLICDLFRVGRECFRPLAIALCRLLRSFHLNPDAVNGFARGVEDTPGRLWRRINDQASLTIPCLYGLHDVPVGWQLRPVGRDIVNRSLHRSKTNTERHR